MDEGEAGEVVTLLGSNGAGKSTTLNAISGSVRPAAGEILFEGRSLRGRKPEGIVRQGIAHVRRIIPGLTVCENIMLGASNRSWLSKRQLGAEADAMLDLFPDLIAFGNALG